MEERVTSGREVIGRHGEETQNDNGRRLLRLCATNGLTVMNRCFEHKDIHKYTWESIGVEACVPSLTTLQ